LQLPSPLRIIIGNRVTMDEAVSLWQCFFVSDHDWYDSVTHQAFMELFFGQEKL
jgi:hypothetical protein